MNNTAAWEEKYRSLLIIVEKEKRRFLLMTGAISLFLATMHAGMTALSVKKTNLPFSRYCIRMTISAFLTVVGYFCFAKAAQHERFNK